MIGLCRSQHKWCPETKHSAGTGRLDGRGKAGSGSRLPSPLTWSPGSSVTTSKLCCGYLRFILQ